MAAADSTPTTTGTCTRAKSASYRRSASSTAGSITSDPRNRASRTGSSSAARRPTRSPSRRRSRRPRRKTKNRKPSRSRPARNKGDAHLFGKGERPLLVFGVLGGATADLVGGILFGVRGELATSGLQQVDVEAVRQPDEEPQHVRHLVRDAAALGLAELRALLFRQPLEQLDELGGLDGQRHREVLRAVEALPVALRDEGPHARPQLLEIPHAGTVRQS